MGSRSSRSAGAASRSRWTRLADRLRAFVDRNPDFEVAVDRLATFLARDDADDEIDDD